ncbi:MAG: hypothetical protein IIA87_03295 [Nanoarchaeota archaeon]|nr:hypothetical protein [Nanoarchaeota archaeon]
MDEMRTRSKRTGKIQKSYTILKIRSKECYPWLLKIHYAKRIPNIVYAFGLFKEKRHVGVITFGYPPAPTEQKLWRPFNLMELNRLVVKEDLNKNALSYFVSQSLNMLPRPSVIISYADIDYNHSGYIYQATNWIYTGIGSKGTKRFIMKDGKERHSRHLHLIKEELIKEIKISIGKHRYFYFLGNKKDKENMKEMLLKRYEILSYPKAVNKRYEIINKISHQSQL